MCVVSSHVPLRASLLPMSRHGPDYKKDLQGANLTQPTAHGLLRPAA